MNSKPTNQPPEQEYEPFGDEWVKEVKKLPKDFLIEQWKQSRVEIQQLKAAAPPATVIQPGLQWMKVLSYWKERCKAAESLIDLVASECYNESDFKKWMEFKDFKNYVFPPSTPPPQPLGCDQMRDEFISSLHVLRSMLNRAGLTKGVETADHLLNKYEQK